MKVDALIRDLQSESNETRYQAADRLYEHPDARAVDALIAALSDSYDMVRRTAALALGAIGDPRAAPHLIQQALTHEDNGSRSTATAALGSIGDVSAVEPLIGLLEDADATVRAMAAQSLGKLGDTRATEPLLTRLGDRMYGVRGQTIEALAAIADPACVEPLAQYYWATEGDRRVMARDAWTDALQAWTERGDLRPLRQFLELDVSDEPIVKSILKALKSVESGQKRGAKKPGSAGGGSKMRRPWWRFWSR